MLLEAWRHWLAVVLLALPGCASDPVLPPMDLQSPGWKVWTGQVIWQRATAAAPIAAELLAAYGSDGQILVNLSKSSLPLFTAQAVTSGWRIDFVQRGGSRSGGGKPPARFVWFFLPSLLADPVLELSGWSIDWPAADQVVLANARTGERIQVILES